MPRRQSLRTALAVRPLPDLDGMSAVVRRAANRHWFRNLAVAEILGDVLEKLEPAYPEPPDLPTNRTIV